MTAWLIANALPYVIGLAGAIAAVWGIYGRGKADARQNAALDAAEAKADAHATRRRIEDEIADDTDLAARARASGLVRPGGK